MNTQQTLNPSNRATILTIFGGEILEGKLIAVNFLYNKECDTYMVNEYIFAHNGKEMRLDRNTKFYENLDCLNQQIYIEPKNAPRLRRYENKWFFNGLTAEKFNFTECIESFTWDGFNLTDINDKLPSELFSCPEDAVAYETQTIIREDGTTEKIDGNLKPLLLTDEQKALAEEFRSLSERMTRAEMGIIIIEGTGYVVNTKHIEEVGCCGEYETIFRPQSQMQCDMPTLIDCFDEVCLRMK